MEHIRPFRWVGQLSLLRMVIDIKSAFVYTLAVHSKTNSPVYTIRGLTLLASPTLLILKQNIRELIATMGMFASICRHIERNILVCSPTRSPTAAQSSSDSNCVTEPHKTNIFDSRYTLKCRSAKEIISVVKL